MKICVIVTRGDDIGGAQIHVRDVVRRMVSDGHEVYVLLGGKGNFHRLLEEEGIPTGLCPHLVRHVSPRQDLAAFRELRRHCESIKPDLLSLHSSKTGVLGRLVGRSLRIPCIFTAHGWAFTEGVKPLQRTAYKLIEKNLAPLAARIICVSDYDYQLGIRAGIAREKLVQIHNGISCHSQGETSANQRQLPRAVMVARFDAQKDQMTLISALARVPGLELDLVGGGAGLQQAQEAALSLGVGDRVRFLGFQFDPNGTLQSADIFCLISNYEGFPYTTLEAMRAGLPTIVSNVGGAGEAVVDGKTGFLIPKGSIDVLAEKLQLLARNVELRQSMGAAAKQHFLRNFTFDRMYNRTMKVYQEVLRFSGSRGDRGFRH
jgi:glycosyltransferase involved in cell wall biosynthesis